VSVALDVAATNLSVFASKVLVFAELVDIVTCPFSLSFAAAADDDDDLVMLFEHPIHPCHHH
jgi:hypothetical protein